MTDDTSIRPLLLVARGEVSGIKLAARFGWGSVHIYNIERGSKFPQPYQLEAYERVLRERLSALSGAAWLADARRVLEHPAATAGLSPADLIAAIPDGVDRTEAVIAAWRSEVARRVQSADLARRLAA